MTSSISSGSFEDVRPRQVAFHHLSRQRQPVMLLQSNLSGCSHALREGQQPGFAIAMVAPIDGNGFQPEVDRRQMRRGGDARLVQNRGSQQPAKPRRILQDGQILLSGHVLD